ncbi:MAG: hypothetical protein COB67_05190 [SAR324 cluster bacterium]|uniref:HTH luxR-type domain-containing protein n=1 Tax=SAR324 cluster bacterium TaxID=2024889 RepID=A0A2A4T5T1_9DELT|nr:MAG: hypothetical protein COB67_05190 [SAR324 cluster bacterium]
MNESLPEKEVRLLLKIISEIYQCRTEVDTQATIEKIKTLIPFEDYSIGKFVVIKREVHSAEGIQWFNGIPDFEEFYFSKKLFNIDPIFQEAFDQIVKGVFTCQFWKETYEKRPNSEFFRIMEHFQFPPGTNGYSILYQLNRAMYASFSIAGPKIPDTKDPRIVNILSQLIPHIAGIPDRAKIGKTANLTDKQFTVYKLLKTSMKYDQIAEACNITASSVSKHFSLIKKKMGVQSKDQLYLGVDSTPS